MTKAAAIYIRVSRPSKSRHGDTTAFDHNPAMQEEPLRGLLQQRGWELYRVYSDRTAAQRRGGPASTL